MKARLLCLLLLSAAAGCSTCAKLDEAKKPFPCIAAEFDGGQCPDGWRCGLAGRCFDPAVGEELACTDALLHCADGWRCASNERCFDPSVGAARECRADAGDCPVGWRCGVAGRDGVPRCQELGDGGFYPCRTTDDCEAVPTWRCDPVTATCVQIPDGLLPSTVDGTEVERVSPRLDAGVPGHVAVGRMDTAFHPIRREDVEVRTIAFTHATGLVTAMMSNETDVLPDGGWTRTLVRKFPLDERQVVGLAAFDTRVGVVFDGGLLQVYEPYTQSVSPLLTNVMRVVPIDPNPENTFLTQSGARAVALGRDWVRLLMVDGGTVEVRPNSGSFTDVVDVSGAEQLVLLLAGGRLYGFEPANPSAVTDLGPVDAGTVRRLHALTYDRFDPFLVAEVETADGGAAWGLLQSDNCPTPPCAYVLKRGPCPVCPSGAAPLQFSVTNNDRKAAGEEAIVARCPATGGTTAPVERTWKVKPAQNGNCAALPGLGEPTTFTSLDEDAEPFAFGVTPARASATFRAHGAPEGRVWWAEDGTGIANSAGPLHPLILDRAPSLVVRFTQQFGTQRITRVYATVGGQSFDPTELGFTSEVEPASGAKFVFAGTVQGRPGVIIGQDAVLNLNAFPLGSGEPQVLATLEAGTPPLSLPAAGAILSVGSPARSLLVVTSRDTVYAADVTNQFPILPDGGVGDGTGFPPAKLSQRLVPAPGVPLRDLAAGRRVRVEPGAEVPQGTFFVLARDQVYEVDMYGDSRWTVTPVPVSPELGEPLELWTEYGNQGRLAYASGQISALPVTVALGEKLPAGARATDFARMCGDTFAIVGGGVKHYDTTSGWEDVPGISLAPDEQDASRFFETGSSLFLGTPRGRVLELSKMKNAAGLPACQ